MDQTWSNWISDETIIEIYHQIFNFIYFLIRLNQICPQWIKLYQIGFLMKQSLNYIIRFSTLFIFWSVESDLSTMDQILSNYISDEIIIEIYNIRFSNPFIYWSKWIRSVENGSNLIRFDFWWNNHWNISSDFQLYLFFDQIESDLSKMDQNGSNLIKLDDMI
jgi:hypothetical protein